MPLGAGQRASVTEEHWVKASQIALSVSIFLPTFNKDIFYIKYFSAIKRKVMQVKWLMVADIGSQGGGNYGDK